jgi:CBS domain-containing protein
MKRTAKDVMTKTVVVVGETAPYKEIVRLLDEYRVNALPVVDGDGVLVGIVSEADLLLKEEFSGRDAPRHVLASGHRRVERAKAKGQVARDVMTSPVVTATPDEVLVKLARVLHDHNVKQVPVTSPDGHVVGIVSRRDLLRVFLRTDEEIRQEIVDEVITRTLWLDRSSIRVTVAEGVVTVEGQVEHRSLAEWLVELVAKVDGVVGVDSHLSFCLDDRAIRPGFLLLPWGVHAPDAPERRREPQRPRQATPSNRLT